MTERDRLRQIRWRATNAEHCRAWSKQYYEKHRAKINARKRQHLSTYGLKPKQFEAMTKSQNDRCAICGQKETVRKYGNVARLSVDHDHKNNRIRALLCSSCNLGLGFFRDSPEILLLAIAYLEKFGTEAVEPDTEELAAVESSVE